MLDNASDLQLVLVTLALMALFSCGGVRGYRAGRRWIARRYIRKIVRECQMASAVSRLGPTLAYSQGHSTRARYDRADQGRTAVRPGEARDYSESCYTTTTLTVPKDVA